MPSEYPPENFEPEIERRLTIPRIILPSKDTWKGYVAASEIAELGAASPMEQKAWVFASALEQQIDLLLGAVQLQNYQMRQMEASIIRARMEREAEKEKDRGLQSLWRFLKWAGLLVGAAAIAFFAKKFLPQMFP